MVAGVMRRLFLRERRLSPTWGDLNSRVRSFLKMSYLPNCTTCSYRSSKTDVVELIEGKNFLSCARKRRDLQVARKIFAKSRRMLRAASRWPRGADEICVEQSMDVLSVLVAAFCLPRDVRTGWLAAEGAPGAVLPVPRCI